MSRTHRLTLALLAAVTLVVTGCTAPVFAPRTPAREGAAPGGATPAWKPCPEVPRDLVGRGAPDMTYECATIRVPADWNAGGGSGGGASAAPGGDFEIALLRVRSGHQRDRIGSLVINPGGPGGSGIDTAVYLSFGPAFGGLPDEVTQRFDIVGFDPRGVSRSSPVKCVADADWDAAFGYEPDPATREQFDGLLALNKKIGERCGAQYGERLRLYSTEQAARDMDAVRAAVGDDKLTYLGYSYGTLLGAVYAQLFPRNVRAFVLDGAVDPKLDVVAGSESQAKGFELAFGNFDKWCASTPARCPIAPDARTAVTDAIEKARTSPVHGGNGRDATAGWIFYAVISSLYTEAGWQQLAQAIESLEGGDPGKIFDLADEYTGREKDGRYSNLFDANLAVNCADAGSVPSVDRIRELQSSWRRKYPLFGPALAVGMLSCVTWPGQRDPYPTDAATGAPPVVVVGTTGDPATPYEQAPRLARMLQVGTVLTWEGEGHTAYPQTRCITEAVNRYLIDLAVPPTGQRCPAR
ncbi:alpha/beta hydrolase fold [Micromonospora pattaloongensis]|uniref:Alpha/beta hydrolase fold n=1 Tax=Micromonospora pattaloongensis TaxID=405436 RepID=A0A1H3K1K6_9ACTN|nr:alpha/beta hydrolase fold [Micromonospora pattaloongensis]